MQCVRNAHHATFFVDNPWYALTGQQRQETDIVMRTKPMREVKKHIFSHQ